MNSISEIYVKCPHNDRGFCRKGKTCRYKHFEKLCENIDCDSIQCKGRHPRNCKYFSLRGYCKFGSFCKYKHVKFLKIDETKDICEQLKVLKDENIKLQEDINKLRNDLENKFEYEIIREEMTLMKNYLNDKIEKKINNKKENEVFMLEINNVKEEVKMIQNEIVYTKSEISDLKISLDDMKQRDSLDENNEKIDSVEPNPITFGDFDYDEEKTSESDNIDDHEESKVSENIPCENCTKEFYNNEELQPHMCDDCIVSLAQSEDIYLPEKFQCGICQEAFQTKTQFKKHTNCNFHFELSILYICEECDICWKNEDACNQHMKLKHDIIKCVRCNLEFKGKECLDIHHRTEHRAF